MNLVTEHLHIVPIIAGRLAKTLPYWVRREDLIGYGYIGLMEAAQGYEPERGFLFDTYARHRVKGAMLDGLRLFDWFPRKVSEHVAMEVYPVDDMQHPLAENEPELHLLEQDERKRVQRAIQQLEPRDRLLVCLYFYEGVPLHELGTLYGLTESMMSLTMKRIRKWLNYLLKWVV